jgi:hypothetical protein
LGQGEKSTDAGNERGAVCQMSGTEHRTSN